MNTQQLDTLASLTEGQVNTIYAQAYSLGQQGKHEAANSLFALLALRSPGESLYANAMGICYRKLGRHEDALCMFAQALQLDPANHALIFQVAECLLLLGRRDDATALLHQIATIARDGGATETLERCEAMMGFLEAPVQ